MGDYHVSALVAIAAIALEIGRAFIGFPDWLRGRLGRGTHS
jgi:hypothetical protein